MNEIYSGYNITLNKLKNRAYKGKMLNIEGNSKQETRDEIPGKVINGGKITVNEEYISNKTQFTIDGNSEQETTEGYNLIDFNDINGTATAVGYGGMAAKLVKHSQLTSSNTYTVSFDIYKVGNSIVRTNKIQLYQDSSVYFKKDDDISHATFITTEKQRIKWTVLCENTLNIENTSAILTFQYRCNSYIDDTVIYISNIQIEEGSTAHNFEPYTGGQPSPNPNYPQDIEVIDNGWNEFDKNNVRDNFFVASTTAYNAEWCYTTMKKFEIGKTYITNEEIIVSFFNGDTNIGYSNKSANTTFEIPNNTTIVYISTKKILKNTLQITKGTTEKPYLPHGCIGLRQNGKNYLKINYDEYTYTQRGITCSYKDNKFTLKGTATDNCFIQFTGDKISDLEISNIPLNYQGKKIHVSNYIHEEFILLFKDDINNKEQWIYGAYDNNKIIELNPTRIWFFIKSGTVLNKEIQLMIVDENEDNYDYEPYHEPKIIPINLNGNSIAKVGDVKDLLKVYRNGDVEIEKNIGKVVLDGSENWGYESSYLRFYSGNAIPNAVKDLKRINTLSSHFQYIPSANNNGGCFTYNATLYLYNTSCTSITEFQTWLSTHNTEVYYPLEIPQTIKLPSIDPIELWEGTNIFELITNLDTTMELTYNYLPALPSIEENSEVKSVGDNIQLLGGTYANPSGYVSNGVEFTYGNNGLVHIKGTSNERGYFNYYNASTPLKLKAGTYVFSLNTIRNLGMSAIKSDTGEVIDWSKPFTLTSDTDIKIYVYTVSGVTYDEDIYLKLSKGTSIGAWSPYGQGSVEITNCNENLAKVDFEDGERVNVNFKNNLDGTLTLNGTCTMFSSHKIGKVNLKKGVKYYLSGCDSSMGNGKACISIEKEGERLAYTYYLPVQEFISTVDGECDLCILLWFSTVFNNTVFKPMLKTDNTISFEPNQSQTKVLYTQKPFRAIGDVRDRFVKKDGVWDEEHPIIRRIFDGRENWLFDKSKNRFGLYGITTNKETSSIGLCNYYGIYETYAEKANSFGIGLDNFRFYNDWGFETVDEFKYKLTELYNAGTPLYVDYVLATPELISCTPEQSIILDQLENIQLYDGINHIYSVGEVRPLLELQKYYMMEDYDMYISTEGFFTIPGTDIKFKVNFMESSLPSMPEASESSVRAAGRDGDYVLNTTYEPIPFEIVCYTDDNLTITEKKEIEAKVNGFLNSIKNKTKRLAFELDNKFYDVKYNNILTTIRYPAHLKFSIPLKSSESYAKDTFEKVIAGNNSEISDTINPTGALITINGPATLPIIALNDYSIEYNTVILEGARLEIDTSKSTATHINSDGVRTNVMGYYNHQFPKIEPGENTLKVLSGVDDEYNVTVKWNDLKL